MRKAHRVVATKLEDMQHAKLFSLHSVHLFCIPLYNRNSRADVLPRATLRNLDFASLLIWVMEGWMTNGITIVYLSDLDCFEQILDALRFPRLTSQICNVSLASAALEHSPKSRKPSLSNHASCGARLFLTAHDCVDTQSRYSISVLNVKLVVPCLIEHSLAY